MTEDKEIKQPPGEVGRADLSKHSEYGGTDRSELRAKIRRSMHRTEVVRATDNSNNASQEDEISDSSERQLGEPSLLHAKYNKLKKREAISPHPDTEISIKTIRNGNLVSGVHEDQPEYEILRASGISETRLASGHIRREQLLAAGYIFLNKMGGAEKGIMSGEFPDPDDPTKMLDFTDRVLLTREELRKIYAYQQANHDRYGLQREDLDEVRRDMMSFIYDATFEPLYGAQVFFLKQALPDNQGSHDRVGTDEDWGKVEQYWNAQIENYRQTHPETKDNDLQIRTKLKKHFSEAFCKDIYIWPGDPPLFGIQEKRGHTVKVLKHRRSKLQGETSPFLESGFVFSDNPDVEVFLNGTSEERGERRINMGNLHIAGGHPDFHGLSEMGGDDDQIYMPLGIYVAELYPKDATDRESIQRAEMPSLQTVPLEDVIIRFQERLIETVKGWEQEQSQPVTVEVAALRESEKDSLEQVKAQKSEEEEDRRRREREDPNYWL
jgi:hypothetical protein